jgi:SEC-C motif-containing protein
MISHKDSDLCPCGSGEDFSQCCQPVLAAHSAAKTAEQLMRSRYTSFVLKHTKHLLRSWQEQTRPAVIQEDEPAIQWLGLEIDQCERGSAQDTEGMVSFSARFLCSGTLCQLSERSRFVKEDGLWFYLDGESSSHTRKVAKNEPCPCGTGKKFKRCCLKKDKIDKIDTIDNWEEDAGEYALTPGDV